MIGTRPRLGLRESDHLDPQPVADAVAIVDGALASVGSRDAVGKPETVALLEAVQTSVADLEVVDAVALIVDELVTSCEDAALVGTPTVADALLDIRLALATSS